MKMRFASEAKVLEAAGAGGLEIFLAELTPSLPSRAPAHRKQPEYTIVMAEANSSVFSEVAQYHDKHFGIADVIVGRAPGRLEFIGNHVDYNGGPVIGASVDRSVTVGLSRRQDDKISLHSIGMEQSAEVSLADIRPLQGKAAWANYALGVLHFLQERGMQAGQGVNLSVVSDLPAGAGMSSSAAFELATAYALCAHYGFPLERADMARIARKAENEFVGVPCGILDQGVSAFGDRDKLVKIDCEKEVFSQLDMPGGVHFWVFNSTKKHALIESLYAARHKECMEAFALLKARHPELTCLARASLEQLDAAGLPEVLDKRARHVISECERVHATEEALRKGDLASVGQQLFASHKSSRTLFENSVAELDTLVDLLGQVTGVIGARLTGGGFGGAVMAVTDHTFSRDDAEAVQETYAQYYGEPPRVFHTMTGPGARLIS